MLKVADKSNHILRLETQPIDCEVCEVRGMQLDLLVDFVIGFVKILGPVTVLGGGQGCQCPCCNKPGPPCGPHKMQWGFLTGTKARQDSRTLAWKLVD